MHSGWAWRGVLNLFPLGSGMETVENQSTPDSRSTAGARLRQAGEAAGRSRADIATLTKIAERHLLAIEENRFGDLAARTYAVGFSRAYERALGLDDRKIVASGTRGSGRVELGGCLMLQTKHIHRD